MQMTLLMRSTKVKRSLKSSTSEKFTVAPKIYSQIMNLFILTFEMHGNVRKDPTDYFDMPFRPFNV